MIFEIGQDCYANPQLLMTNRQSALGHFSIGRMGQFSISADSLEFKRKYPAIRMKVFGLDSHPHIKLINHLGNYSIGISHIILVPPDWDKNTSPLDMLKDTTGKELWHWLAVDLNLSCIGTIKMNTYGTDSGQSGEKRTQYNIEWRAVYLINEGLKLNKDGEMRLLNFLASGETKNLSNIDYKYLYNKRRQTPPKLKDQN